MTLAEVVEPATDPAFVDAVLARDPVANVFAAARIAAARSERFPIEVWRYRDALCLASTNLVPIGADATAAKVFGAWAARGPRRCSSLVGPSVQVMAMWDEIAASWGAAREVRATQPLLVASWDANVAPDPDTRAATAADLPTLFPAAVAMYQEEVGTSPLAGDGGVAFRARLAELVSAGLVLVKRVGQTVVFKAEIGSVAGGVCQVQGVWTHPAWRGQGIATSAMVTVVQHAQANVAPVVSLYVNDFNAAARRVYAKCGFEQVGTFATVLL